MADLRSILSDTCLSVLPQEVYTVTCCRKFKFETDAQKQIVLAGIFTTEDEAIAYAEFIAQKYGSGDAVFEDFENGSYNLVKDNRRVVWIRKRAAHAFVNTLFGLGLPLGMNICPCD